MTDALTVGFVPFSAPAKTVLAVFCDGELKLGPATRKALGPAADLVKRAAAVSAFKGKNGSTIDLLEPEGIKIQRLIVIGTGKPSDLKEKDFLKLGGVLAGKLNAASTEVTVMAEHAGGAFKPGQAAALAARAPDKTVRPASIPTIERVSARAIGYSEPKLKICFLKRPSTR